MSVFREYVKCGEFADCTDYVYKGDELNQDKVEELLYLYSLAVTEIRCWLHSVLCQEMSEEGYSSVSVSLRLPFETLLVKVDCEASAKAVGRTTYGYCTPESLREESPELLNTPIGMMDYFTYQKMLHDSGNPVALFYKHLGYLMNHMHELTETQAMLNAEILRERNVKDILQLYKMDTVLRDIHNFFHDDLFSKAQAF